MSRLSSLLLRGAVPLVIVGLGGASAGVMFAMADTVEKKPPTPENHLVDVITIAPAEHKASIVATGVVQASRRVSLVPQVGGRIVWQSEKLVPGGRFSKGATLAQVDDRDYAIALRQAESQVRQAELEVQLEAGRKAVAEREWALLGDDRPRDEAALALRDPHGQVVATNLEAAKASRDRCLLDLERTVLRAPFNAMMVSESLEVGQVVSPGQTVASLIGTDTFWISVSVGVDKLGWVEIPSLSGGQGSSATLEQDLGDGERHTRRGRVVGLEGELDPTTRTARLLVAVDNPLEGPLPLLSGAYVTVRVEGRGVEQTVELPRSALHDGNTVWVVEEDQVLGKRAVSVVFGDGETVVVNEGLLAGDRVVTSPLAVPLVGQPVTLRSEG